MKNSFWVVVLSVLCLLSSNCGDKEDDCMCKSDETCIYDAVTATNKCYLTESVHYLGGTRIIAPNSYVGVTTTSQCIDTLIFYNDTTRAINDEEFGMLAKVHNDVLSVMGGNPPSQISSNEYKSSTVEPLCNLNGDGWYASLHFKVYPDSVWMKLKYWTLESPPGVFIDSNEVMFYKTH